MARDFKNIKAWQYADDLKKWWGNPPSPRLRRTRDLTLQIWIPACAGMTENTKAIWSL